jgi:CRISPR/Cas system endoribonuclease Cas6 (RAMP superfamily)
MFFQVKENFNQTHSAMQAKELVYILRETRVKPFFPLFFKKSYLSIFFPSILVIFSSILYFNISLTLN